MTAQGTASLEYLVLQLVSTGGPEYKALVHLPLGACVGLYHKHLEVLVFIAGLTT